LRKIFPTYKIIGIMKNKKSLLSLAIMIFAMQMFAQEIKHKVLIGVYGGGVSPIAIIDYDGSTIWEHPIKIDCNDIAYLKDGTILYCDKKEVNITNRNNEILWTYKCDPKFEMHTASETKNGNILLVECGTPAKLLEINRNNKVKVEIEIPTNTDKKHRQFRNIRKTIDDTYLIPYLEGKKVCEFDKKGKLIRTIKAPGDNYLAIRLKNGNTMIACGDAHCLIEVDINDNIVWRLDENDLEGNTLFFVADFEVLPNGNIMIANWGGHGHLKEQAQLIEITRDKKVVWSYTNWNDFGTISTFKVLDNI